MRKTIKNVMMVVPVLMTSCHVSENLKTGPVTPHTTIVARATANAHEPPVHAVTAPASPSSPTLNPCLGRSFLVIAHPFPGRHRAWRSLPASLHLSRALCVLRADTEHGGRRRGWIDGETVAVSDGVAARGGDPRSRSDEARQVQR